jgi:hypothetical protein
MPFKPYAAREGDSMSLFSKVSKFARSPQGKKVISQAQQMAKDPNTKRKIADVRARFAGGKKGAPPPTNTPR